MFGEIAPKLRTGINFNIQSVSGTLPVANLPPTVALTNAANSWSVAQLPNIAGAVDIGSTSLPFRSLFLTDNTDTSFSAAFTPQALSGNRTVNIPNANSTTVQANAGSAHNFVTALSGTTGALTLAQPASSDLSDVANIAFINAGNSFTVSQIPGTAGNVDLGSTTKAWRTIFGTNSTNTTNYYQILPQTLTGNRTVNIPDANTTTVQANAGTTHNFVTALSATTGALTLAQPSSADLSDVANIVFNNTANTYTGTHLQDHSAAGQTMKLAGGGTTVNGVFTSDAQGTRTLGSSSLNFLDLYLGTASFSQQLTNASLTGNRVVTFPDANSNTVRPSAGSAHQFANAISVTGVITYAQPAATDISGLGTAATENLSAIIIDNGAGALTIGAGQVTTTMLGASQVTYAKIQNETAHTLLGNPTGSGAAPSEITLGTGLTFSGTILSANAGSAWCSDLATYTYFGGV